MRTAVSKLQQPARDDGKITRAEQGRTEAPDIGQHTKVSPKPIESAEDLPTIPLKQIPCVGVGGWEKEKIRRRQRTGDRLGRSTQCEADIRRRREKGGP